MLTNRFVRLSISRHLLFTEQMKIEHLAEIFSQMPRNSTLRGVSEHPGGDSVDIIMSNIIFPETPAGVQIPTIEVEFLVDPKGEEEPKINIIWPDSFKQKINWNKIVEKAKKA
jgi:hypothetical protein